MDLGFIFLCRLLLPTRAKLKEKKHLNTLARVMALRRTYCKQGAANGKQTVDHAARRIRNFRNATVGAPVPCYYGLRRSHHAPLLLQPQQGPSPRLLACRASAGDRLTGTASSRLQATIISTVERMSHTLPSTAGFGHPCALRLLCIIRHPSMQTWTCSTCKRRSSWPTAQPVWPAATPVILSATATRCRSSYLPSP